LGSSLPEAAGPNRAINFPKAASQPPDIVKDDAKSIACEEHGAATSTYVCSHLAAEPVQRWHSARASEDNRWPDAWCGQCNVRFLQEGEWNDRNFTGVDLRVLCHHCYETALAKSIARLTGQPLQGWQDFVRQCHEELKAKQEALTREYSLGRHKRWDWDQERGDLVFSSDKVPAVIATIEFVGSVSTKSNTWLWSWANPSTLEAVRSRISAVYDFGEARDYPNLTVPKWPAEETDGWDMAAVAAHVLDVAGVYRTPSETGFTFLLLTEVRTAQ
jgi:hypothetical protein